MPNSVIFAHIRVQHRSVRLYKLTSDVLHIFNSVIKVSLKRQPESTLLSGKSPREWPIGSAKCRDVSELSLLSGDYATFPNRDCIFLEQFSK